MKERLKLALSWYAFAQAVLIAVALFLLYVLGLEQELGWFVEALNAYVDIYQDIFGTSLDELVFFGIAPAIWLGLWITTGKPRILPWKG